MYYHEHDYHLECPDTKGILIEGQKKHGAFRRTFHCFLTIRDFLDKIAWENCSSWEEYLEATKHLDGCKLNINGVKFKIIYDAANSKKHTNIHKAA